MSLEAVQALRDRVETVLNEELPEEQLALIWSHVKREWNVLYPQSAGLMEYLSDRTGALNVHRLAFETLFEVMNQHLENLNEAAGYRAETDRLNNMVEDLTKRFGHMKRS